MGLDTGYFAYKGSKEQSELGRYATDLTEQARQESLGYLEIEDIMRTLEELFPGFMTAEGADDGSLSGLMTQTIRDYFEDPGISSAGYERAQEISNQNLRANVNAIGGGLTGGGFDPNSEMGQTLTQGALRQNMFERNEANRDFTLAEEQVRDQRLNTAMTAVQNILSQIFGLQQGRATITQGNPVPQAQALNPYEGLMNWQAGNQMAAGNFMNQMGQQQQSSGSGNGSNFNWNA